MIEYVNSDTGSDVIDKDSSVRELCISLLRSHHLLEDSPARSCMPMKVLFDDASTEYCRICGGFENILSLLICDSCEEAFHKSCCNPEPETLLIDDWFCPSCVRRKGRSSSEIYFQKSHGHSWSIRVSKIEKMLRCPNPYTSRVGIGSAFQAEVPEWSGRTS